MKRPTFETMATFCLAEDKSIEFAIEYLVSNGCKHAKALDICLELYREFGRA